MQKEIAKELLRYSYQMPANDADSLGGIGLSADCPPELEPLGIWMLARARRMLDGRGYLVLRSAGDRGVYLYAPTRQRRKGDAEKAQRELKEVRRRVAAGIAADIKEGRMPARLGWD